MTTALTFAFLLIAAVACVALLRAKRANDRLYGISLNEFYDAAERLMKTPEDLPDEILELLEDMSKTIRHPQAEFAYLAILRERASKKTFRPTAGEARPVPLRRELETLMLRAANGWLVAIRHKSTLLGWLIEHMRKQEQIRRNRLDTPAWNAEPVDVYTYLHRAA